MKSSWNFISTFSIINSIYRFFAIILSGVVFVSIVFGRFGVVDIEKIDGFGYAVIFSSLFFSGIFVDSCAILVKVIFLRVGKIFFKRIFAKSDLIASYEELAKFLWPIFEEKLPLSSNSLNSNSGKEVNYRLVEDLAAGMVFFEGDDRIFKWATGHYVVNVLGNHAFILFSMYLFLYVDWYMSVPLFIIVLTIFSMIATYWRYYVFRAAFRWCLVKMSFEDNKQIEEERKT